MNGGISFTVYGEPFPKPRPRGSIGRGPKGPFVRMYTPAECERAEAFILGAFVKLVGSERVGAYQDPVRAQPARRATKHQVALPSRPGIPGKWLREPTFGLQEVELELEFHFSGAPIADGDNCEKLVLDALNRRAWRDDNRVMRCTWSKTFNSQTPRTVVSIKRRADPGGTCHYCHKDFVFRTGPGDDAMNMGFDRWKHARCWGGS